MASNPCDMTGKVVVVTGGNAGIGLGFARGIAKAGGDVVIWGRGAIANAGLMKNVGSFTNMDSESWHGECNFDQIKFFLELEQS